MLQLGLKLLPIFELLMENQHEGLNYPPSPHRLGLKQFCNEISIDQNKIFLKCFCFWTFLTFINDPSITNGIFLSNLKLIPSYLLLYATVSELEPILTPLISIKVDRGMPIQGIGYVMRCKP